LGKTPPIGSIWRNIFSLSSTPISEYFKPYTDIHPVVIRLSV